MRTAIAVILCALALRASALEVSLEENKAQRGNIGYVDMQKLFRMYPETQKAKQNFEEVLRQAEDQVNLRKAELIGLRADVIRLRMERDAASKLAAGIQANPPAPVVPAPAPPVTPAVSTETITAAADTSKIEPAAAAASTGTEVAVDTATAVLTSLLNPSTTAAETPKEDPGAPLIINLPGLSPEPIVVQPPKAALEAAASLPEIESKLAERSKVLQDKDAEFKVYQGQVEKNLLELEEKKTEILLGKIYRAVQEVARDEGVSVVVDRSQILFGHQAMDLTDKVIKKLKS
ncbi:MAG: OmpH family outer membrane protein [Elusimicrobia bacterium]|nr:OmpH family outer membrane protein [Elusimicrobiota bacterium]